MDLRYQKCYGNPRIVFACSCNGSEKFSNKLLQTNRCLKIVPSSRAEIIHAAIIVPFYCIIVIVMASIISSDNDIVVSVSFLPFVNNTVCTEFVENKKGSTKTV